jgi:hypothetical protein
VDADNRDGEELNEKTADHLTAKAKEILQKEVAEAGKSV